MNKQKRNILYIGILLLVLEVIKQFLLTFVLYEGKYCWKYFPFQLCSIPIYICLIGGLSKSNDTFETCLDYLSTYGLLGGICAFLDTTGFKYDLMIITIHSYVWHIILIVLGIYAMFIKKTYGFKKPTLIYLFCCLVAALLNYIVSEYQYIDMFYINTKYKMNQIVFVDIAKTLGNKQTIVFYMFMTIVGAYLLNLFSKLIRKIN